MNTARRPAQPMDRSDLIVSRTAAFCALALFLILILEKLS
jgi:hypothetical protein